jgi:hypothetical protein
MGANDPRESTDEEKDQGGKELRTANFRISLGRFLCPSGDQLVPCALLDRSRLSIQSRWRPDGAALSMIA